MRMDGTDRYLNHNNIKSGSHKSAGGEKSKEEISTKSIVILITLLVTLLTISMVLDVVAKNYGISFWLPAINSWVSYALFPEIIASGMSLYLLYRVFFASKYRNAAIVTSVIALVVIFLGEFYRRWGSLYFTAGMYFFVASLIFVLLLLVYIYLTSDRYKKVEGESSE